MFDCGNGIDGCGVSWMAIMVFIKAGERKKILHEAENNVIKIAIIWCCPPFNAWIIFLAKKFGYFRDQPATKATTTEGESGYIILLCLMICFLAEYLRTIVVVLGIRSNHNKWNSVSLYSWGANATAGDANRTRKKKIATTQMLPATVRSHSAYTSGKI